MTAAALAHALLATAGFLLAAAIIGFVVFLIRPFAAQAWADRRRKDGWAQRIRRYGGGV